MKNVSFLSRKDNTYVYNQDGELLFYLPEAYFSDSKSSIAIVDGEYITTLGIFDWATVSTTGKVSDPKPFKFPTIIRCKPYTIEKVKGLKLLDTKASDYRILHFKSGDEVISDINIPKIIDNVEIMFKNTVITGNRIPSTVRYDKAHEYFPDAMELNGNSYGLNMQLFGIMISELYRDPNDLTKPFRYTNMKSMTGYSQISIKNIPKYISPYTAFTSENFDESLMSSILLDTDDGKEIKESPMEKFLMM